MKCLWCGEKLTFRRGKGWVHPDGKVYKTKLEYPQFCMRCGTKLTAGYCPKCEKQHQKVEVDDHCALPVKEGGE